MYKIDDSAFHEMAKETYNRIKDNPNIPYEIKDAWLEACVNFFDVSHLTN